MTRWITEYLPPGRGVKVTLAAQEWVKIAAPNLLLADTLA